MPIDTDEVVAKLQRIRTVLTQTEDVTFSITVKNHPEGAHLVRVVGQVLVTSELVYEFTITTSNTIEDVPDMKERIADELETWATANTSYIPETLKAKS